MSPFLVEEDSPFVRFIISAGSVVSLQLLSYIVSVDGGPQLILNLRKLCITVKHWIDNLPTCKSNKLFSKIPATITICRKELAEFLEYPPPEIITSLKINNVLFFDKNHHTLEELNLLRSFAHYWNEKIYCLEAFDIARNCLNILSAPTILRVHGLSDIHEKIFDCTELHVSWINLTPEEEQLFFARLGITLSLKRLSFHVGFYTFGNLASFIETRKLETDFELNITYQCGMENETEEGRFADFNLDVLKRFVKSVNESASLICLFKMYHVLDRIVSNLEFDDYKLFCMRVESIGQCEEHNTRAESFNICPLVEMKLFPNLTELYGLKVAENSSLVSENLLPPKLIGLSMTLEKVMTKNLPKLLSYLSLEGNQWKFADLEFSLRVVSQDCILLKSLSLSWQCREELQKLNICRDDLSKIVFPNLEWLQLQIGFSFENTLESSRIIFFDLLKINTISIVSLLFATSKPLSDKLHPMALDSNSVSELKSCPLLLKSLSVLEHSPENLSIAHDATEIFQEFETIVKQNKKRREEIYGRQEQKLPSLYES